MVYVGLGSNVGDSSETLASALGMLRRHLRSMRVSSVYRTEPVGVRDQRDFLNAVVCGEFDGTPDELLELCNSIEQFAGRNRANEIRFGPRTLDLDILLFSETTVQTDRLTIPHPRMHERRFVLVPLLELWPDAYDPRSGKRFADLLAGLAPKGIYYAGSPKI